MSGEPSAPEAPPSAPESGEPAREPQAGESSARAGEPSDFERDPLGALRAGLGLPERRGGTPIDADLGRTLRRGGWFLIALGTGFLALWRVLTWLG